MINSLFGTLFSFIKRSFSKDIIISPEQGDVIESPEGERSLVFFVEKEKVYISKKCEPLLNRRGRSKVVSVLEEFEWPKEGHLLYRGDKLLYPQKNYKLSILVWLSNKLLK